MRAFPRQWQFAAIGLVATSLFAAMAGGQEKPKVRLIDRGEYVEDTETRLLWQKDGAASGKKNFYEAAEYASKLKLGGLTGWRVPTADELKTIFPADKPPFVNTGYREEKYKPGTGEFRSYWTSDLDKRLDDYAFVYHWYAAGGANNCFASKNYCNVRCVRSADGAKLAEAVKPAKLDDETTIKVGELIAKLASEEFAQREAAEKELAAFGRKIEPLLIAALEKATDPEVEFRLAKLLETVK